MSGQVSASPGEMESEISSSREGRNMNDAELESLLRDLESDRVERKESLSDKEKIRQAICAFANDMPNHREPGVIFIGIRDDGTSAKLTITDKMLLDLSNMRSDGNILPIPTMTVQKKVLLGHELAVVVVSPSDFPPVRYNGRVWIRVGPRRATASAEEEIRLSEKRRAKDLPFDLQPIEGASMGDLDEDLFRRTYLPSAVAADVLEANERTQQQQMASLRFVTGPDTVIPTVVGLLAIGKSPSDYIPGAYLQFLRIEGQNLTDPIADQKVIQGPLSESLRHVDDILSANIHIQTDIRSSSLEMRHSDYPLDSLQQLVRNAIMHRDYSGSNAPVRLTWYVDRVEIQNPGGPFGQVTQENFGLPGITDYRNPNVAEVMRNLGFVQRFGMGIQISRKSLQENGNPPPDFQVQENHILVVVRRRP
jgi:ATP-dependent DNA helicase RecG